MRPFHILLSACLSLAVVSSNRSAQEVISPIHSELKKAGFKPYKEKSWVRSIGAASFFGVPLRREPKRASAVKYLRIHKKSILKTVADLLNKYPDYILTIRAYAQGDNRWKRQASISNQYAQKVKTVMVNDFNISQERIYTHPVGWRKYGLIQFVLEPKPENPVQSPEANLVP